MYDEASATLPHGAWPVMLTPFNEDRSIDWNHVDEITDWLIDRGSAGIFTVALSSEMYDLTETERLALARRVVDCAAGRVPVVASAVASGSATRQSEAVKAIADTGVTAVVLISSLVANLAETEDQWRTTTEAILDANPGVDFGIYECPLPYKRLCSLQNVAWMAQTGRFVFFKDTSHSVDVMRDRLEVMAGTRMRLFNAQISSLTTTLRMGAAGFSGYAANIYPEFVAWLCEQLADAAEEDILTVQRLLTVAEHSVNSRYPTSAKYFLAGSSRLDIRPVSRWRPESIGDHEGRPLLDLAEYIASLGLPTGARVTGPR
ncbi:dihydrodipicolinate synthase family protein [Actinopolymorpha alba]|uniref:dihydrodipicolinate synthase family protein n=1 Tax=Actinopolymorpha alba TaxID=533267 RepID=UPI0003728210|nr:dihydrodipicolinate synthase family protein [Actinopolymorpha alba]